MRSNNPDFPHAILHIDGDAFFVSCELTRRPELRGKPCVTGAERGIATAVNYEAKALGVKRGMRIREIKRLYKQVNILPSDYELYRDIAGRMYEIVRRYADDVEEYSIDECFADLSGMLGVPLNDDGLKFSSYEDMAHAIQSDLHKELGVTFSIGLGVNKVTAKIASKWNKPAGFTVIRMSDIPRFLEKLPIGKIWGIGGQTAILMSKLGIITAADLAHKDRSWVAEHCDRPVAEIWQEFHGAFVKAVVGGPEQYDFASVQRTRTFWPVTRDPVFLWSQLSYHVEDACEKLRSSGRQARRAGIMLKTQDFSYIRREVELPEPLAAPDAVLAAIKPHFDIMFRDDLWYRTTGIYLGNLEIKDAMTGRLFEQPARHKKSHAIYEVIDRLATKFGRGIVYLGSSWKAVKAEGGGKRKRSKSGKGGVRFLG